MKNLVFTGLPGCGKTTLSRRVAEELGRPWYDTDHEIEREEYKTVAEIFATLGEDYFRGLETDKIAELTERSGCVLAVGGGAVLRNGTLLRHNSDVFYIRRDVALIAESLKDDSRPLARSGDDLRKLYEHRKAIYEALADYTVDNNGSLDGALAGIMEVIHEADCN